MTSILIIDDSPTIRKSVEITLKKYQFKVLEAADGPSGLEQATEAKPDLILLDINLTPEMDGFAVLEKLKANPATRAIPVMMLTSKRESPQVVRATKLGAIDYIVKPFQPNQLVQKVFRQTESRKAPAKAPAAAAPAPAAKPSALEMLSAIAAGVEPPASEPAAGTGGGETRLPEPEVGEAPAPDLAPASPGGALKAIMVIYHSEFHDELTELMEKDCGVLEYVEVPKAWGLDGEGRHINTHVWPGTDSILFAPLPEFLARDVCDRLRAWKQEHPTHRHLRVLVLPVEACV